MKQKYTRKTSAIFSLYILNSGIFILILSICIISTPIAAKESEEFEPDVELVKQLITMSYSDVTAKLDTFQPEKNMKYCLIMAKVQNIRNNSRIAIQYCDRAFEISQKHNLPECEIYLTKASIHDETNNMIEAIDILNKAADCYRKNNDVNSLKICFPAIGSMEYRYGRFEKSLTAYKEALKLCEDTNDTLMKADTLFEIGEVYYRMSDMPNAKKAAEQAKIIFEKSENTKGLADCLKLLGNTCLTDDNDKAKKYYIEACKLYEETNDHHGLANCYFNVGLVSSRQKKYSDSIDYLTRALRAYTKSGSIEGAGIANMELGRCYFLMKDYDKAEITLSQAEQFLGGLSQFRLAQTKDYQGDLYAAQGKLQQASDCYKMSAELYKITGLDRDMAIEEEKIRNLNYKLKPEQVK